MKVKITKEQAAAIGDTISGALRTLVDDGPNIPPAGRRQLPDLKDIDIYGKGDKPKASNGSHPALTVEDEERLYQSFKNRFIDEARIDPTLLRLMMVQPEVEVFVERQVQQIDTSTLRGRIARMMAEKYFAEPKAVGTVRKELTRRGTDPGGGGALYDALAALAKDGFLRKEGEGYQLAPGVKVTERTIESKA